MFVLWNVSLNKCCHAQVINNTICHREIFDHEYTCLAGRRWVDATKVWHDRYNFLTPVITRQQLQRRLVCVNAFSLSKNNIKTLLVCNKWHFVFGMQTWCLLIGKVSKHTSTSLTPSTWKSCLQTFGTLLTQDSTLDRYTHTQWVVLVKGKVLYLKCWHAKSGH